MSISHPFFFSFIQWFQKCMIHRGNRSSNANPPLTTNNGPLCSERGYGTNSGKSELFDKIATYTRLDTHNKLQSADRAICCSNFGFRRAKWGCCRFLQIRRAVTVLVCYQRGQPRLVSQLLQRNPSCLLCGQYNCLKKHAWVWQGYIPLRQGGLVLSHSVP